MERKVICHLGKVVPIKQSGVLVRVWGEREYSKGEKIICMPEKSLSYPLCLRGEIISSLNRRAPWVVQLCTAGIENLELHILGAQRYLLLRARLTSFVFILSL